jgi:AcrR family transcriptional regulator
MTSALAPSKRPAIVTRPYGGVKAEARRQERRQRLLAAGLEVFGHHGYHHTTVRNICDAAGLTERYFYESFKSLRLLFDAVHEQLRDELVRLTLPTSEQPHPSPLQQVEASLRAWLSFLQTDPRRARIMLIDASVIEDLDAVRRNHAAQAFQAHMLILLKLLHPNLSRHGIELELTAASLNGALLSLARTWAQGGFATGSTSWCTTACWSSTASRPCTTSSMPRPMRAPPQPDQRPPAAVASAQRRRQCKVSPPRSGLISASPNGSDSGTTQSSRTRVMVSVWRGRP